MDRAKFYNVVRGYTENKQLVQTQVNSFEFILNEWERHTETGGDIRHPAYILATSWHETGKTMEPVREAFFLGDRAETYRKTLAYYPYYGRGFVQLTWKANYDRYHIADDPDQALNPVTAAHIIVDGMVRGTFTGRKLSDFFSNTKDDPVGARAIINGNDRAATIAQYYEAFYEALTA